jgi:hypothetical protein
MGTISLDDISKLLRGRTLLGRAEKLMSTSTPHKPSVPKTAPVKTATMFGVSIAVDKQQVAEKPPMSEKRKRFIIAGGLLLATALVLWIQYRPTIPADPEVADHPAVKDVSDLAAKKDISGLTQYTKNEDGVVAQRAIAALAKLSGVDAINGAMNDPRPDVRAAAVSELADRADVGTLPVLSQYLQDQDPAVRITAIRGIASVRDFSIFDYLVPMLDDPQPSVRRGAISAIEERIGLKFPGYDPARPDSPASMQAVARVKSSLPLFKQRFDTANQYEAKRGKK